MVKFWRSLGASRIFREYIPRDQAVVQGSHSFQAAEMDPESAGHAGYFSTGMWHCHCPTS